ncbi:MAG: hypothetical protein IKY83_14130 [Proteobacteria bacterium]|nr:hypothetical protein [Pseudomonadota bacterium]
MRKYIPVIFSIAVLSGISMLGCDEKEPSCKTEGYVSCSGTCIDPKTSNQFCGANEYCEGFVACKDTETCFNGRCRPTNCEPDEHHYDVVCEKDSADHCGEHGVKCADKVEGWKSGTCVDKSCILDACNAGLHIFENTCVPDDANHCGSHDKDCSQEISGWSDGTCENGACHVSECQSGLHAYSNACEADDVDNCGAHGTSCSLTVNGWESGDCILSACTVKSCAESMHVFENACELDDVDNCGLHGRACASTVAGWKVGSCTNGTCKLLQCIDSFHLNADTGECVQDTKDCCSSACNKCVEGLVCAGGECRPQCKETEAYCNGECINPNTSTQFCGADASCSGYISCSEAETCIGGKCIHKCEDGMVNCGSEIDPACLPEGDSDNNGIPNCTEAGNNPHKPLDTDGDTIPDYLDHDNDGDTLSDVYEIGKGYDYNSADSDGDGADDLIEVGAGTDPMNPKVNPQSEGKFVFKVPYKQKTEPAKQSMSLATSVQMVDIYFAIDTSASMQQEITTLKTELPAMLDMMRCKDLDKECADNSDCRGLNDGKAICSVAGRCIVDPNTVIAKNEEGKDEIVGCFVDMWTGFGVWGNLNTFRNWQSLDADPAKTTKALNAVVFNALGDDENSVQVGACVSEGTTYCTNSDSIKCYNGSGRVGCAGFRPDAIKILIQAGDEGNSDQMGWKMSDANKTGNSLRKNNIRYIGLYGTDESSDKGLSQVACWAGSCAASDNCALTCQSMTKDEKAGLYLAEIKDANIKEKTVSIVRKLAKDMNLHITTEVEDVDKNAAKLIKSLKVNVTDEAVQGRSCTKVQGISNETFPSIDKIAPGTSICFDVIPVDNQELFKPTEEPQVVKAKIKIMGDGSTLNSGIAYFLIPPKIHEEH